MQNQRILERVRGSLGDALLSRAIVYLSRGIVKAGTRLQAGDALIDIPWDADVAFVDLEPGANWGHACYYLAIRVGADDVINVAARMPPFLKAGALAFGLLWRSPAAPEWAVGTSSD